jgi:hypothetical protein
MHKWYKCLHVPTNHVYISRDVTFDEHLFPFPSIVTTTPKEISEHALLPTLCPIPLPAAHDQHVDQAALPMLHDASNPGLPSIPGVVCRSQIPTNEVPTSTIVVPGPASPAISTQVPDLV